MCRLAHGIRSVVTMASGSPANHPYHYRIVVDEPLRYSRHTFCAAVGGRRATHRQVRRPPLSHGGAVCGVTDLSSLSP